MHGSRTGEDCDIGTQTGGHRGGTLTLSGVLKCFPLHLRLCKYKRIFMNMTESTDSPCLIVCCVMVTVGSTLWLRQQWLARSLWKVSE